MTWTKLSDDFADDCWTLTAYALRLHIEGLCWSNRKLLDCRIPKGDVRRFAHDGDEHLGELLAAGWWTEEGDAYVIVHHAAYQRRREDVLKQQAANAANGKRGGRPPKVPRQVVEDGNPVGLRVASPAENRKGQDRTGLDRNELPPTTERDEQTAAAAHSLVQASFDEEPPWLPDDPDYTNASHDSYR